MLSISDALTAVALVVGGFFFMAGAAGLLRLPDVFTRLHALTKADNLGLGLIAFGVAIGEGSASVAFKLLLVWVLAMWSAATSCHIVARLAFRRNYPVVGIDATDQPMAGE